MDNSFIEHQITRKIFLENKGTIVHNSFTTYNNITVHYSPNVSKSF